MQSRLSAYHDDALDPAERAQFEEHLRTCPACATELELLRAASGAFGQFRSARLDDDERASLHAALDESAGDARFDRTIASLAVIAASVLIVGLGWLRLQSTAAPIMAGSSLATSSNQPWEQVAVTLRPDPLTLPVGGDAAQQQLAAAYNESLADWMLDGLKPRSVR